MEVRIQAIHFDATEKLQDFIQKKTAYPKGDKRAVSVKGKVSQVQGGKRAADESNPFRKR